MKKLPLSKADVIKGLKGIIKERGFLYNVDEENQHGNQISALKVEEENVVYSWSVLRDRTETLEESVRDEARQLGFKGVVVISDRENGPAKMFGQTFKDLVLLHQSEYMP